MQQSEYITPRIGRRSVAIVSICCLVVCVLIAQYQRSAVVWGEPQRQSARAMLLLGSCYGVASGLCWLATAMNSPWARCVVRMTLLIATAYASTQVGTENWLRHLSGIGGFLFGQCLMFFALGVPDWETQSERADRSSALPRVRQFGTGDVIVATTAVALLLAIIIRYLTPIESTIYWLVMVLVWIVGPSISACVGLAALSRHANRGMGLYGIGLLLAIGGTYGIAIAEYRIKGAVSSVADGFFAYAPIVVGYFFMVLMVVIAGRIQSVQQGTAGAAAAQGNR